MATVLLINPSYQASYGGSKASIVNPIHPTLGLATIAATARQRGHRVEILDLSWRSYDFEQVRARIRELRPDVVGLTATTPLMNQVRDISMLCKDISREIVVVAGGPHPSALPEQTLRESQLDAVCVGEADYTFAELCDRGPRDDVAGLCLRDGEGFRRTAPRPPIPDLDALPMPAWDLYDPELYRRHMSRLLCRRPPATMAEFSRGCVFKCDFCASKITMALGYRKKSPERCAAEVREMHARGFREFMLADDIFTSDQKWAGQVCEAITATGIDMAWSCTNGIRVESADEELFRRLRRAGCYRVSFGFESGNDEVLRGFGKGGRATLELGVRAVQLAREAGIDTNGYFQLGLSVDTEATMRETIAYARRLPLDMLKFGITIAFPGTPMFDDYARRGLVRSYDWDEYHMYTDQALFAHPNMSYETVRSYMDRAYRTAILGNPAFHLRRLRRGLRNGEVLWDLYYFAKFLSMPSTSGGTSVRYYARERWPTHDWQSQPPGPSAQAQIPGVRRAPLPVAQSPARDTKDLTAGA